MDPKCFGASALVIGLVVGCGGEPSEVGAPPTVTRTTTHTGSGGAETTSTGAGAGEGPDAGGGSGGESSQAVGPIDALCGADVALEAAGAAFVFPTPPDLAQALGALTFDPTTHPLTVVLRVESGHAAASAAADGAFLGEPSWGAASVAQGGFAVQSPLAVATLRLVDPDEGSAIDVALANVTFTATTLAGCSYATVLLDAVVPTSQGDVELPVGDKDKKKHLSDLAGDPGGGQGGWLVRMLFQAQSASFDFASLEESQP